MPSETEAFFDALLGTIAEESELWIALWARQTSDSLWIPVGDGSEAIAHRAVVMAEDGQDAYITVSAAAAKPTREVKTRIQAKMSAGIFGFWADLDFGKPIDSTRKLNYPPDEKAVMEFLDHLGVDPSIIVHSGNGLHVWWLFKKFWSFDSQVERTMASTLSENWYRTLSFRAAECGYIFDATFDLSRLLRIPGTVNYKNSDLPVPVRLLSITDKRYDPEDFRTYLVDDETRAHTKVSSTRTKYHCDPSTLAARNNKVVIPKRSWDALCEVEPRVRAVFEHTGKAVGDGSLSSHDQSLANTAVNYGWSDQDVADLIACHRIGQNDTKDKWKERRYLARTIDIAHDKDEVGRSASVIEEAVQSFDAIPDDDDDKRQARRDVLDNLGIQLGLHLSGLTKYTSEPPTYRLNTPTHSVLLGLVEGLLMQMKFRNSVVAGMNYQMVRYDKESWDAITRALIAIQEEQSVGVETTARGRAMAWIRDFLDAHPPIESKDEGIDSGYPFPCKEGVAFQGPSLRQWLFLENQEKVDTKDLGPDLRLIGCFPIDVNYQRSNGGHSKKSVWIIPPKLLEEIGRNAAGLLIAAD
jgi:hypothetical protein